MDFLTVWDPAAQQGDWQVQGGDLVMDAGLATPVTLSLGTDRLAHADDALPGDANRRGHWADAPVNDGDPAAPKGSRLWLLAREEANPATRRRAEEIAREALAWMVEGGLAASVDVGSELVVADGTGRLSLAIVLSQRDGQRQAARVYDTDWLVTLGG